jgi:hypothetical protein
VLLRIDSTSLLRCRKLGLAGSALLVLGGVLAGVPPMRDPILQASFFKQLRTLTTPTVMCVFAGVSLLVLAWWRLGRLVRGHEPPDLRELLKTMLWWAGPLMVTMPIFSRDVYSYLAQGTMTVLGIDAYQYGPAILGGPLSLNIPAIWQTTPAPYGPVFLSLASDVTSVTGESTWFGILGMRLLALGGMALLVWSVPRIARASGVDPGAAMWLGVLNPLVLINLVADAHNDALMLGLMMAGLALALERRPAAGAALVALAALVKAPAGLGLVFIVSIWAAQMSPRIRPTGRWAALRTESKASSRIRPTGRWAALRTESKASGTARWVRAGIGTFGVAAGTVVVTTTIAGTGYGWIGALDTPTLAHTWTSITTDLGFWTGLLTEKLGWATGSQMLALWRMAGLAAAGVTCLWLLRRYHTRGPIVGLGLGLAAVLALGPVVHPWYLLWAIVPLAAAAPTRRIQRGVVVASIAMTFTVLPGGVQPGFNVFLGALLGVGLVFGAAWAARNVDWQENVGSAVAAVRQMLQREPVAVDAESADDPRRDGGHDRMVPERFTRVDIRDVHFDQRAVQQRAGVPDGVGVVGPRPGVEHDRRPFVRGGVQPAEHLRLGVGLADLDRESELLAEEYAHVGEVGVRGKPVDIRLARAEAAKIRPVEYEHLHDETSR